MPNGPFIRYFCHVADEGRFGDLSLTYFEALKKTGTPMRVLATNMARVEGTRWAEFFEDFSREVPKHYINMVCGDNGELVRLFTVGTKNVAITASYSGVPTDEEIVSLRLYDAVLCPTEQEAAIYKVLGIMAMHVEPDVKTLAALIRGFL